MNVTVKIVIVDTYTAYYVLLKNRSEPVSFKGSHYHLVADYLSDIMGLTNDQARELVRSKVQKKIHSLAGSEDPENHYWVSAADLAFDDGQVILQLSRCPCGVTRYVDVS